MSTVTCMPPTSPSANSKEALSVSRWRGQFPSSSLPFFLSLCRNELPATSCASSSIPQTMYAVGAPSLQAELASAPILWPTISGFELFASNSIHSASASWRQSSSTSSAMPTSAPM